MTEGPGRGGYPDLAKPQTRYAQAVRHFWTQTLVTGPTQAHRALNLVQATRRTVARKRK